MMETVFYVNPIFEIILVCVTLVLLAATAIRDCKKAKAAGKETVLDEMSTKEKTSYTLNLVLLLLASGILMWVFWKQPFGIVGRILAALLLIEMFVSFFANAMKGLAVVYSEIEESGPGALSETGTAVLVSVCLAVADVLLTGRYYLAAYFGEFSLPLAEKQLLITVTSVLWYFFFAFHILCLAGVCVEQISQLLPEKKTAGRQEPGSLFENTDAAGFLVVTLEKIRKTDSGFVRFLLYIAAVPFVFLACLALRLVLLIGETVELIFTSAVRFFRYLGQYITYILEKIGKRGGKSYVWFCFRISIIAAVICTVAVFQGGQILMERDMQILILAAEAVVIPLMIHEIIQMRDFFKDWEES